MSGANSHEPAPVGNNKKFYKHPAFWIAAAIPVLAGILTIRESLYERSQRLDRQLEQELGPRPPVSLLKERACIIDVTDNDDVRTLQVFLNKRGYEAGAEDGLLGPQTQRAIGALQLSESMKVDMVFSEATCISPDDASGILWSEE